LAKASFNEKTKDVGVELECLKKAITALKNSKSFVKILEIILALGNYLNGQSARGGVYGYKLSSLTKMLDVKSADGKSSLMHYLVTFLETKYKEHLKFLEELEPVHEASRVSLRETMGRLTFVKTAVTLVDNELKSETADPTFKKTMEPFLETALSKLESLEKQGLKVGETLKELVESFGEAGNCDSESFFNMVSVFIVAYEKSRDDIVRRAALAEQAEKAKKFQEELKKQAKEKGGKGHLDMAIENIKSGKAFSKRLLPTNNSNSVIAGENHSPPSPMIRSRSKLMLAQKKRLSQTEYKAQHLKK